jgi:hypothetical protein
MVSAYQLNRAEDGLRLLVEAVGRMACYIVLHEDHLVLLDCLRIVVLMRPSPRASFRR